MRVPRILATCSTFLLAAAGILAVPAMAHGDDLPVAGDITVPKVEGMGEDWINGVDVSSVLSLEEAGVQFFDEDGEAADLFEVLADHGVNWVRVRVWNDPFDSEGNGYGGGNVDAARATLIAQRATDAGMRVLVNFHYSDFWAHPGQQQLPKAWKQYNTVQQRAAALKNYTMETLSAMKQAGVDVGMVQIGNETTPNDKQMMAESGGWDNFAVLVEAGSQAVRDVFPEAQVAVHFTNPERGNHANFAKELANRNVDYDVFLTSYYPFWHGTLENLTSSLNKIATTYNKDVAVAEVSWAYTLEDGDGHENTIRTPYDQYSISVQGQALAIRDVMQAVANVEGGRGIGTFYWEPAWLPVGPAADVEANKLLWEQYGAGWASSYATEYDPNDAGVYFGGSAWDNQALFDFQGHPLDSLKVYRYAETGAVGPREIDSVVVPDLAFSPVEKIVMPDTVEVYFTDGTREAVAVEWDADLAWIKGEGQYLVPGRLVDGSSVKALVSVEDLAAGENLILNGGFEDPDTSMWQKEGSGFTVRKAEDPHSGSYSTHWYSSKANRFSISQTLTDVPAGTYRLSAFVQGGGAGPDDRVRINAQSGIHTASASASLEGYGVWQNPTTAILPVSQGGTVDVWLEWDMSAGAWGTLDDVAFSLSKELPQAQTEELNSALKRVGEIGTEGLSSTLASRLNKAVARAEFVLGSPLPSQDSVDAALTELSSVLDEVSPPESGATVELVTTGFLEGDTITLPAELTVFHDDGSRTVQAVTWDDVLDLMASPGIYAIGGKTEGGYPAEATVTIRPKNWVLNGDFEQGFEDVAPWEFSGPQWESSEMGSMGVASYSDIQGSYAFQAFHAAGNTETAEVGLSQIVPSLPAATYRLAAVSAGGNDVTGGASDTRYHVSVAGDGLQIPMTRAESQPPTMELELLGWPNKYENHLEFTASVQAPVTLGISAELVPGDWSYIDDVQMLRAGDPEADSGPLTQALEQASSIDLDGYVIDGHPAVQRAVARAQTLLQADFPSAGQLDQVLAEINDAVSALVLVTDGPGEPTGPGNGGGTDPGTPTVPGDGGNSTGGAGVKPGTGGDTGDASPNESAQKGKSSLAASGSGDTSLLVLLALGLIAGGGGVIAVRRLMFQRSS